ncbi:hypothetical protein H5410_052892 [Solanum commersonii]|uniref:Uncharacterized protein n=1 Tax=Solanum commersonii TaxID=4109 RepID=A0A9J5X220_SOLCO|nr:hypothetical protein H5410_052892 [Solanum commersonii]
MDTTIRPIETSSTATKRITLQHWVAMSIWNIVSFFVVATMLSTIVLCCQSQLTETPNVVVSQEGTGDLRTIS